MQNLIASLLCTVTLISCTLQQEQVHQYLDYSETLSINLLPDIDMKAPYLLSPVDEQTFHVSKINREVGNTEDDDKVEIPLIFNFHDVFERGLVFCISIDNSKGFDEEKITPQCFSSPIVDGLRAMLPQGRFIISYFVRRRDGSYVKGTFKQAHVNVVLKESGDVDDALMKATSSMSVTTNNLDRPTDYNEDVKHKHSHHTEGGDFHPTYDFQSVGPDQSVPPGLEIHLSLDGSQKREARIPLIWRLQIVVRLPNNNDASFFFRTDVSANSSIKSLFKEVVDKSRKYTDLDSDVEVTASVAFVHKITKSNLPVDETSTVGNTDLFNIKNDYEIVCSFLL